MKCPGKIGHIDPDKTEHKLTGLLFLYSDGIRNEFMRELWDVYTIDRKKTGKTCIRGEQSNLADDEFHLWVMDSGVLVGL